MIDYLLAPQSGLAAQEHFFDRVFDQWTTGAQEFVSDKLPHLVVATVIALLLIKLLQIVTKRMIRMAERHGASTGRLGEVKTLAGVFRATGLAVIAVITVLQYLAAVDINLAPLLASAGVAGVAIGLAAQTMVKDMINGMLFLLEGQFNVGDTVRLAGLSGTVESMTLRKTTVRDGDGTLYVIPNSQITTVANLSAGISVATVNVSVDFSANPDDVIALLKGIAMEIRNSDPFKALFAADPQVLGVDAMKGSEMIFPVVFKTMANQQYAPVREFRRRVRLALEEHKMLPGDPYRVFRPSGSPSAGEANGKPEEAASPVDPTTIKPQETNPFSGE